MCLGPSLTGPGACHSGCGNILGWCGSRAMFPGWGLFVQAWGTALCLGAGRHVAGAPCEPGCSLTSPVSLWRGLNPDCGLLRLVGWEWHIF